MIGGLILAAGSGSRFGGAKQLAELEGKPLLDHAVEAMSAVPAIERIVVVLGSDADTIRARANLDGVDVVVADDWAEGVSASLRAGIAALRDAEAVVVTLADQPLITPEVISAVVDLGDSRLPAARATYGGNLGHPVLIKRELFDRIAELAGDAGARDLLELAGVAKVECGHLADPHDVDTRNDLAEIAALKAAEQEAKG